MTEYNNRRMGWIVKVALALFVLFGASQSYAACFQSNLTGIWYLNGISGDTFFAEFWETDFCKIKVNSTGNIVNSASQCNFRDDNGKGFIDVQGGSLTVNSSCSITGKLKYCVDGICTNFNIDAARMDKGKTVITLVGRLAIDPDIVGYFTGVKK